MDQDLGKHLLSRNIAQNKRKLKELSIFESFNDDPGVQQAFRSSVKQLLECCQDSLEHFFLHAHGFYILPLLPHQALKNLSKLELETRDEDNLQVLWNVLASIDSGKMMPKLEEVRIMFDLAGFETYPEWPANKDYNGGDVRQSYHNNVRKLKLQPSFFPCNLIQVRTLFPHVTSLDYDHLMPPGHVPCREFWELWPQLEELRVSGVYNMPGKNYDAIFCGMTEEEAELLREMDDEFLRTVLLVPVRPSLLTVPSKCNYKGFLQR